MFNTSCYLKAIISQKPTKLVNRSFLGPFLFDNPCTVLGNGKFEDHVEFSGPLHTDHKRPNLIFKVGFDLKIQINFGSL